MDNFERVSMAWGFLEAELRALYRTMKNGPTDVEFLLGRIRSKIDDTGTCLPVNWTSDPRNRDMVASLRAVLDDIAANRVRAAAATGAAGKKTRNKGSLSKV